MINLLAAIQSADPPSLVLWGLFVFAAGMYPVGFMLGAECSPCCQKTVCLESRPYGNPSDYENWMPNGNWIAPFWTKIIGSTGDQWHFFGSAFTSARQLSDVFNPAVEQDWNNPCNWWVHAGQLDPITQFSPTIRASGPPPEDATVFVHTRVRIPGSVRVRKIFFKGELLSGTVTTTDTWPPIDGTHGTVFGISGSEGAINRGTITEGATFISQAANYGTVSKGAWFHNDARNDGLSGQGTVSGGAVFKGLGTRNFYGSVSGGATFLNGAANQGGSVSGGAIFNDGSRNTENATVQGGATFNNSANMQSGSVSGGAVFNGSSTLSGGTINDGATFNDSALMSFFAAVNGEAVFNDAACSVRYQDIGGVTRFVAGPGVVPTCNGSAPSYVNRGDSTCGCG